ncbi:MAG: hypothetical protein P9E24_01260 [Candidatus Competibacter sp.]|nr:hypothetical protein [Candidatus Competibacter sp.]MDG4583380.1 hypothetical protein [Candidatus Competibacter sp.]
MIPIRALLKIDVAARKQEASTAVAIVRLLGWSGAIGLWWWLGALNDEQVLLLIAGVESVAALARAVLPDRFGGEVASSDRVLGARGMRPTADVPPDATSSGRRVDQRDTYPDGNH